MTPEEFQDQVFKLATGALGWPPDVAWNTPIPEILLAYDGKVDWFKATNGTGGKEKPVDAKMDPEKREEVAADIRKAFGLLKKRRAKGAKTS